MSSALKNRLVGTIIVVALAVIFLPDILDGKKQTNQDVFADLPERPAMRQIVEAKPFPSAEVKQTAAAKIEIVPDVATDDFESNDVEVEVVSSQTEQQKDRVSQVESNQPAPSTVQDDLQKETVVTNSADKLLEQAGWVVQLGVFRHQKNVRELLTTLRNAGYRGFSRPVKTSSGELTKVFVGPDLDKGNLEKALPHLKELTKLQGRITPFTVK